MYSTNNHTKHYIPHDQPTNAQKALQYTKSNKNIFREERQDIKTEPESNV